MSILFDKYSSNLETKLGIHATWWTKQTLPQSLDDIDLQDAFEVKDVQDRGEYFERPKNATGVIVTSEIKLATLAAWRNKDHKGPWQIYSEQEKNTVAFHYLGDTETIFIGWV